MRGRGRQVKCSPQGLREVGDISEVREHQERGLGMWGNMDQSWGERRGQTWADLRRKRLSELRFGYVLQLWVGMLTCARG